MNKPHVHAELIKAWADGAIIQWYDDHPRMQQWVDCGDNRPSWANGVQFRIKPEPKPDVVRWCYATKIMGEDSRHGWPEECQPNLKLVICGETGKLKSAEVIQ